MYTLKIKWMRHKNGELVDEATHFIPADQITVQGSVKDNDAMSAWPEGSYIDYRCVVETEETGKQMDGRLIEVNRGDKTTWYLASLAWLMGPNGDTIERLHY